MSANPLATTMAPALLLAGSSGGADGAPDPADRCEVVAFGRVKGTVPPLFYRLQALPADGQIPLPRRGAAGFQLGGPPPNGTGVALPAPMARTGSLRLVAGGAGRSTVIKEPRLVRTVQEPLVVIQAGATMSMHPNFDQALCLLGGIWARVTDNWPGRIRIPKGVAQLQLDGRRPALGHI